MNKKLIIFIYFMFIFTELYLGSISLLFGYSPRLISVLFFIIIIITQKIKIEFNWLTTCMTIYVTFYFFSVLVDDFADLSLFVNDFLLSRFLITTAIVCITLVYIPKYISFDTFINILLVILSINTFILIGQFQNYSFINPITEFIVGERFAGIDMELDLIKHSTIHGLLGTVYSGYIVTVVVPLILYKLEKSKYWFSWIPLLIFTCLAVFVLQQRSAFYLIIINVILYFVFFTMKKKQKSFLRLLIIFPIFLFIYEDILISLDISDSFVIDIGTRLLIYTSAFDFISNNLLFGGQGSFLELSYTSAHNIFLNSWIRAGVFGFLSILFVFIKMTRISIRSIKNSLGKNILMYTFCTILINLFIMSLTHNSGLVTGEVFTFIFVMLILKVRKLSLKNIQ